MNLGNYMITISLLLVIVVIQLIMNGLMKKKRFKKHVTKSNFHSSDKLNNVKKYYYGECLSSGTSNCSYCVILLQHLCNFLNDLRIIILDPLKINERYLRHV